MEATGSCLKHYENQDVELSMLWLHVSWGPQIYEHSDMNKHDIIVPFIKKNRHNIWNVKDILRYSDVTNKHLVLDVTHAYIRQ